nr:MAG TPA: hypothetical protein [Bacteriophage sp.]
MPDRWSLRNLLKSSLEMLFMILVYLWVWKKSNSIYHLSQERMM